MNIIDNKLRFKIFRWMKPLIFIVAFVFGFFYCIYLYKTAQIIPGKLAIEYINKTGFKFINNFIESDSDNVETMYLTVKYKEWRKLVNQRNKVWNYAATLKYFPFQWTNSIEKVEIKGRLNYKNDIKKVKLKLMGTNSGRNY